MPSPHDALAAAFVAANRSPDFARPACTDDDTVTPAWHSPVPVQRAPPRATLRLCRPSGPPTATECPLTRPSQLPAGQSMPTAADPSAPRTRPAVPGPANDDEAVSVTRHSAVPVQRMNPRAALRARWASGPACTSAAPFTQPWQPASGQSTCEPVCPFPCARSLPPLV